MPITLLLAISAVFLTVILVTWMLASLFAADNTVGRRLQTVTRASDLMPFAESLPLQGDSVTGAWASAERILGKKPKEMGRLRARLARAGYKDPSAPVIFATAEVLLPVICAVPAFLLIGGQLKWLTVALGAAIGFFAPGIVVERQTKARQRQLHNGLPDALDLLIVCMEAGSGIDQAIAKTAEEIGIAYPILGEELRTVTTEMRAGKPRIEAFKSLAERTKLDDVRSLVSMLVQTDRFGTSIGQALRTHAETSRTKRRQAAEEAAQKIGVKLVFPLVLFFFPALYVIILGPAVIQFIRTFMS